LALFVFQYVAFELQWCFLIILFAAKNNPSPTIKIPEGQKYLQENVPKDPVVAQKIDSILYKQPNKKPKTQSKKDNGSR
jgi:hypothetical protein